MEKALGSPYTYCTRGLSWARLGECRKFVSSHAGMRGSLDLLNIIPRMRDDLRAHVHLNNAW